MHYGRLTCPETEATYSICARVVDGLFKFDGKLMEALRKLLYDVADFCGVQIMDFCIMSNHLHILATVLPKGTEIDDDEVIIRVGILYGEKPKLALRQAVDNLREEGDEEAVRELLAPYRRRMNDLSEFMKAFMQRVTTRYNNEHDRAGTLWQGRFRSTLVERSCLELVRRVAAYIDLNPMRAGMVDDPALFPWCAYGLAMIHGKRGERGRQSLALLYPGEPAEVFLEKYRRLLLARFAKKGMNRRKTVAPGIDFSERQPSFVSARVIGSVAFVLRAIGRLPRRGVTPLAGDYIAVGGERRRPA